MKMKSSIRVLIGLMVVGLAFGEDKKNPAPGPTLPDPAQVLAGELAKLASQYNRGADTEKSMASKRDQLALQAQAAIIGIKDAQLAMEQAISAGRFACGNVGKMLDTAGPVWKCTQAPAPKEIPKK